jgi:hypothetical protein
VENRCFQLVSAPCNVSGLQCGRNSGCATKHDTLEGDLYSYYECECQGGYLEDNGFCRRPFSAACDSKNLCARPLECVNGRCKCANELTEFSEGERKCEHLVGARCDPAKDSCVPSAKCDGRYYGGHGKCVCEEGFQMNRSRKCFPRELST